MGSRGPLSGGASPGAEDGFFPFVLDGGGPGPGEPEDLALQLQQKEQDLLLAAELGKMLLERNEELRRQLETLGAQHAEREERLQQENHELRRGLAARGAEWEARAVELEGDVEALRAQLGEQRSEQQDSGRERARALGELSEQNLRLTQQLAQASQTEQELQRELDGFRGQWQAQALAEAELRTRLESLRAENQMLQSRRQDLEAQIRGLRAEVDKGQGRLQTTHEELLLLRRESKESSLELERARSEAAEARGALRRLQRRVSELEEESRLRDAGAAGASLQAELAHSLGGDPGPDASAAGDGQPPDLAPGGQLGAPQEASALEPRGKSGGEGGRSGPAAGRGGAAERGAAEPAGGAAAAEGAPRAGRPRAGRARRAGRPGRGGEQGPGAVAGAEPRLAGARLAVPGADARHPPEGGADAGARGLAGRHAGGDRAAAALPAPEGAERGGATPSPDPLLPAPGPGAGRWLPQ